MTHWNYRVIAIEYPEEGETSYGIHEVFYDDDGNPRSYTEEPISVSYEEDPKYLETILRDIRKALDKPILTPEDFQSTPEANNE